MTKNFLPVTTTTVITWVDWLTHFHVENGSKIIVCFCVRMHAHIPYKFLNLFTLWIFDSICVNFCLSGVQQLLTVAGTIPEHKTIPISQNSRMHVSLCLSKIHEDLVSDQERNLFLQVTNSYFEYVKISYQYYFIIC